MFSIGFISYLLARVFISLASTMLAVAIGWHLYQFSGDAFDLALVGLMQFLPMLLFFIVTGWAVDHFSRKHILVACVFVEAVVFLGLAFTLRHGEINRVVIFSLLFVHGSARAFYAPAMQAVLPNIVSSELLSKAVAIVSSTWTTSQTVGPFIAGVLIAWIDFGIYWLLLVLLAVGAVLFGLLPRLPKSQPIGRDVKQLLGGVRYVFANPIVLPSITLDLLIVMLGSVVALLPIFVIDVLKEGPEALGLLRAMPAFGGVVMGLTLARLPPLRHAGRALFFSLLIFSASIFVFAISKILWLSLIALWVYGAADMISVNVRSTLIQLATPNSLRGRVNAVNMLFISTSNDIGDFRSGSMAAAAGPVVTALAGAGMAFVVAVGGYFLFPTLRKLDRVTDVEVKEA